MILKRRLAVVATTGLAALTLAVGCTDGPKAKKVATPSAAEVKVPAMPKIDIQIPFFSAQMAVLEQAEKLSFQYDNKYCDQAEVDKMINSGNVKAALQTNATIHLIEAAAGDLLIQVRNQKNSVCSVNAIGTMVEKVKDLYLTGAILDTGSNKDLEAARLKAMTFMTVVASQHALHRYIAESREMIDSDNLEEIAEKKINEIQTRYVKLKAFNANLTKRVNSEIGCMEDGHLCTTSQETVKTFVLRIPSQEKLTKGLIEDLIEKDNQKGSKAHFESVVESADLILAKISSEEKAAQEIMTAVDSLKN